MNDCPFKVGDIVIADNDYYGITCTANKWRGIVVLIEDDFFTAKTIHCKEPVYDGMILSALHYKYFILDKSHNFKSLYEKLSQ